MAVELPAERRHPHRLLRLRRENCERERALPCRGV